jgi:hypothetical protein
MAEILIQRKRQRRRAWPWLLGLLALVLLLSPLLARLNDESSTRPPAARTTASAAGAIAPATAAPTATPVSKPETVTVAPTSPAPTPTSFERFIAARHSSPSERAQRRYTADGLRRLADELGTLGASEAGVRAIRLSADSLVATPGRNAAPDYARAAFLAAVRELDVLGSQYAVAVDTGRLRAAAWAISPDRRLLAQQGKVQTFFATARDALHLLSRRR